MKPKWLGAVDRFFFTLRPPHSLAAMRIILASYVLIWRLPRDLALLWSARHAALDLMDPVWILKFLPLPYPMPVDLFHFFSLAMRVLAGCAILGFLTRPVLFFFGLGLLYLGAGESSWGWVNHGPALLDLTVFLMAWIPGVTAWSCDRLLIWLVKKIRQQKEPLPAALKGPEVPAWGLRLILILTVSIFFAAGLSKMRYSGLKWADGRTLAFYLSGQSVGNLQQFSGPAHAPPERAWKEGYGIENHLYGSPSSPLAKQISRNLFLTKPLSLFTLVTELGMPLALLGGWFQTLFLLSAILFLLAVENLMNIYFRPYLLICLLLIDWPWHFSMLKAFIKKVPKIFLLAAALLLPSVLIFTFTPGFLPRRHSFRIVNTHEHFQSLKNAPKFLEAMRRNQVVTTVIVGSPEATILTGQKGFLGEEKYNLEVLKIAKQYPDHFIAFPTLNPQDPEKLEKLKRYLERGGRGLKLYSGHSIFHERPLDAPEMTPVYEFCEKNQVPILFHVNAGSYRKEFENVLEKFPRLKVICPHFCLSTIASQRFEELMDRYPQLYTDASFGYIDFLKDGLRRISRHPEKYRRLFVKYQDRILFGTDMVVTDASYKTADWLAGVTQAYRDVLEKKEYTFFALGGERLRGLALNRKILEKVYRKNFERFFYGKESFN